MALVSESIQSLQLKAVGVEHPLQEFAEETFADNEENDFIDNFKNIDYDELLNDDDDGED
jgi:predicted nuclease of restriction endonuclease-like RecB superfamily